MREKNKKVWNIIGREICKYFTETEGIEMIFEKATSSEMKKLCTSNHYILMLDRSYSMSGSKWSDLQKALK